MKKKNMEKKWFSIEGKKTPKSPENADYSALSSGKVIHKLAVFLKNLDCLVSKRNI